MYFQVVALLEIVINLLLRAKANVQNVEHQNAHAAQLTLVTSVLMKKKIKKAVTKTVETV